MKTSLSCAAILVLVGSSIACSGEAESTEPTPGGSTPGTTQPGTPTPPGGNTPTPAGPADDGDACKLAGVDGVNGVKPTFKVYDPAAGVAPPAMTGGKIEGRWKVDAATVYLPNEVKAVVKPEQSTGTLTSWMVFKKTGYKLTLKTDFQVASIAGPRPQQNDVAAGGIFKEKGAILEFENSCNPQAPKQDAEFSFTDKGDRGVIVIKTKTEFGFSYLELQAARGN